MKNIDSKYEVWKNKLLDLGKRNRLLNYKDTLRSTVKITSPECGALYDLFVKNEVELTFPYENENDERKYDSNIETNKNTTDLQKSLRNLRNKAKTAIEEQGVNVLYLSFGFLKWTESNDSTQVFASPLILVPVTLTVESITSPYVLKLHEDETVLNPTLLYKLENDFGITLPDFDNTEDITAFFNAVSSKITLKNWSISKEVSLGLLSFLKINMYSDLNKHKETIISNPIVRAISGDASAVNRIPDDLNNYDFDKNEKPTDVFQVVDADASQQEAILMAKKGISFVLQGPPGTGKSQTITNIIAECLADGKKVLFVSEKMAALDVVHRRLSSCGLDDFCLVLHSYKANKRNVLDQLGKVLDLSHKKSSLSDEAYQKLDVLQSDRSKLNDYAQQIYESISPLGKSIYEANGIIANLDIYDDLIFTINDVRNTTKEQYKRYSVLLSKFATIIGKMTNDYKTNPWRDCNLHSVSNEFRHDVTSHLNILMPKIKEFDVRLAEIFIALHLDSPHTIKNAKDIIAVLEKAGQSYIIPSEWILTDEIQPLFDEVLKCIDLKEKFVSDQQELTKIYCEIKSNESNITLSSIDSLISIEKLKSEKNNLDNFLSIQTPYFSWNQDNINTVTNLLSKAIEVSHTINSMRDALLLVYEPEIFNIDYKAMLTRIKTEYTSFTKIFKKEYKQDKKIIQVNHKEIVKKISDEEMISLVEKLRKIDELKQWFTDNAALIEKYFGTEAFSEFSDYSIIEKNIAIFTLVKQAIVKIDNMLYLISTISNNENSMKEHYKFLYNGIMSNWEEIRNALNWAVELKESVTSTDVSDSFVKAICQGGKFIDICKQKKEEIESLIRNLSFEYNWFVSNFNNSSVFDELKLSELNKRLFDCENGLLLLEEWIDFNSTRTACVNEGLKDFINIIEQHNIPAKNIIFIFKKRFFRLWLDAVLPEYPAVLNFRRKMQETTIDEFVALDKVQFEIAKARIKSKLINDLPSMEHFTNGIDEISIVKRELNKQRRIMPIRLLFKAIPNLLLTLKPCLMMSPLSVSLFLEAETYKFDIVIFDEASQVCTENAIGAISRAKQVVIAGDSKQLPPTNFFKAAVTDGDFDGPDDEDEFYDSDAYESILDEANMLPERTLRWHYRSRHESLIAFSNAKIYKNNLITFPSNIEASKNNGVEYIYVSNGYYDRGGKKGNVIEANKIADLVFEHIKENHLKENHRRSLGVIAFGEVQQQAIETIIRERRILNKQYEWFFAEDKEEAFFVKNLENVQGDERDTIIFSIGYAKDNTGVFRMNFGPLSKSGGERRLNVAITRAKYNVKLVGSIMPTDIDVEKINSEGPKLLRSYIDFARNGQSSLEKEITESDIVEHDSPFEEAVYNFLDRKGYKLGTQVGCSGYRIDMAVKHPTLSGIYVLGVECDGASYHSARTARERDRLRQDVLENMGWNIYRIWSTDWIKDQVSEGAKLIEAVENAITTYDVTNDFSNSEEKEQTKTASDFVNLEEKTIRSFEFNVGYGFEKFEKTDLSKIPCNRYGYLEITDCILKVVETEYPIHYELLCQRLAYLYGNEKATVKVRREINYGLSKLKSEILRKGDFLFPKAYMTIPIRMPNTRKIQHICIEELSEAMIKILSTCIGTTREALCSETTRVYGFNRAGQNISSAMFDALDALIKKNRVEEIEGKLHLKDK